MNRRDFLRNCAKVGANIPAVAVLLCNLGIGEPIENIMCFGKALSEEEVISLSHASHSSTGEWTHITIIWDKEGSEVARYKNGILQLQTREGLGVGDHTISVWTKAA